MRITSSDSEPKVQPVAGPKSLVRRTAVKKEILLKIDVPG